ncbi:MAG: hypothetical protein ACO3EE_09350 [Flavobacteriales bacterium]
MITTYIEEESGVIWSVVTGVVTQEVLVDKMFAIRKTAGSNATAIKVMNVFENISTDLKAEDIKSLFTLVASMSANLVKIRGAFVANTPRETALSMLYADIANKSEAFSIKVFSTTEAALQWLHDR